MRQAAALISDTIDLSMLVIRHGIRTLLSAFIGASLQRDWCVDVVPAMAEVADALLEYVEGHVRLKNQAVAVALGVAVDKKIVSIWSFNGH